MVPYDLPLHAGLIPRLLITIVGEPIPGADRYEQHSSSNSAVSGAFCLRSTTGCLINNNPASILMLQIMAVLLLTVN